MFIYSNLYILLLFCS